MAIVALAAALPAWASPIAPAQDEAAEDGAANEAENPIQRHNRSSVTDARPPGSTVDMLIEMQDRNVKPGLHGQATVEAAERKARPSQLRTPPPPTAIDLHDAPAPSRSGMFGTGAVSDAPLQTSARRSEAAGPTTMSRSDGIGDISGPRSGSGQEGDRTVRWLLPRTVILWIRENRVMIVGGALLLGAIWLTVSTLSQRRR